MQSQPMKSVVDVELQPFRPTRLIGEPSDEEKKELWDADKAKLRENPKSKHLISRVFNHAEITLGDVFLGEIEKFYQAYFDSSIKRPDFSEFHSDKQKHQGESPFDEKGNFKPWLQKYIPKSQQDAFNQFINNILERADQEIYDDAQGDFNPWIREALGKNDEEKYILDILIEIYGKETIRLDLAEGVACMVAAEIGLTPINQTTNENVRFERDLLALIINAQIAVYISFQSELDKLNKMNQDKAIDPDYVAIRKICQDLEKEGRDRLHTLENSTFRDPGRIFNLIKLANFIGKLNPKTSLYLNCASLLNDGNFRKNDANIKKIIDALDILEKHEKILYDFHDKDSSIYRDKEFLMQNQRKILNDLIANHDYAGIDEFTLSLQQSSEMIYQLSSFHSAMASAPSSNYTRMGHQVYSDATLVVHNALKDPNNQVKFPNILHDSLVQARRVIDYQGGNDAKDQVQALKDYTSELPAPDSKFDPDSAHNKYIAGLINLGNAATNRSAKTVVELIDEKRAREIRELVEKNELLHHFKIIPPSSVEDKKFNDFIVSLIGKAIESELHTDPNRTTLLSTLDASIKALTALKHYKEVLKNIGDDKFTLYANREMLIRLKENELFELSQSAEHFNYFAQMLEQDCALIDNFNALHKEMDGLENEEAALQDTAQDHEKKQNLQSMKNASESLFNENEKMAFEMLQREHTVEDLQWSNDCLKAMAGAIKHRGDGNESQKHLEKLEGLTKIAPGNPHRKLKIIGGIGAFIFAAFCIAGILFKGMNKKIVTLTSSARGLFVKSNSSRTLAASSSKKEEEGLKSFKDNIGKIGNEIKTISENGENAKLIEASSELLQIALKNHDRLNARLLESGDKPPTDLKTDIEKEKNFLNKILHSLDNKDLAGRLGFILSIIQDTNYQSNLSPEKFGSPLGMFVIYAVIKELKNPDYPNKDHDPNTLIVICQEIERLAEEYKDNPEKMTDLASLLTKIVRADVNRSNNPAQREAKKSLEEGQQKYQQDEDFKPLHAALDKLLNRSALAETVAVDASAQFKAP